MLKKLVKHPRAEAFISWLIAGYIRLVYFTNRRIRDIAPAARPYMQGHDNGVFAFWHGRMMLLPAFNPPRKMHVLISLHRDGKLISRTIGRFGQATISGSSSKGGKEAVVDILNKLEQGDNVSITPDGPRGPAFVASRGVVSVARLAGKPVLPVTFSASRGRHFRSWDRFLIAKPFGRIVFCVGEPLWVDEQADDVAEEAARMRIESAMNALVEKADRLAHG